MKSHRIISATILFFLTVHHSWSFSVHHERFPTVKALDRRAFALSIPFLVCLSPPAASNAIAPATRDVDVGGGFDLLGRTQLAEQDVRFPVSMEGIWTCTRVATQIEGDAFQAEAAWKALGGGSLKANKAEIYLTKFVRSRLIGNESGVVNDRGFEFSSRAQAPESAVQWSVEDPNSLMFDKIRIKVVKRTVELPSDQGFGFNELYRIDDGLVTRAAEVKRRYRRAFDAFGNRIVEGLEIMKTFRVLDGVAGTEIPTSTAKSQIRMMRPST